MPTSTEAFCLHPDYTLLSARIHTQLGLKRLYNQIAIQMRGSISNRNRGRQSSRQARIIKTIRTALN